MKRNAIVRIILYAIAIFLLSSILLTGMGIGMYMVNGNRNIQTSHEVSRVPEKLDGTSYTADPDIIRDIEIDWAAGSITIQPIEQDYITVAETEVSDSKYKMIIKESGNKLTVEYCKDSISFFGINTGNYEAKNLVIFVPTDWSCGELEIDAASAELDVSNMTIRNVEFDGASGICSFENCSVDNFDIDTASGDVYFSGTLNALDLDAASASCYLNITNSPNTINLDSMSGDLDIMLPENSGFTLDMDTMSGDFSSEFDTITKNGTHVCGDGRCRIAVSALSGNVTIRKS